MNMKRLGLGLAGLVISATGAVVAHNSGKEIGRLRDYYPNVARYARTHNKAFYEDFGEVREYERNKTYSIVGTVALGLGLLTMAVGLAKRKEDQ